MPIKIKNNSTSLLAADMGVGDLSLNVTPGTGVLFPSLAVGDYFYATIIDQVVATTFEIVKVTAITGDTFTIERGLEGTAPRTAVVGDSVVQYITAQTILDLTASSGSSGEKQRKYLDEFYLSMNNDMQYASGDDIKGKNLKYAPLLMTYWDSFWGSLLKVQIEDTTNHTIYDNLTFATVNDMYTWLVANGATGGSNEALQTFVVRPYETIDETIPVPTKIYGLNRFYSALRGKRNYTSAQSHTAVSSHNSMWSHCAEMFNEVWGTTFNGTTIDLGAIWLTRAKKNMYANPPFRVQGSYRVLFEGTQNRRIWNVSTSSWEPNGGANPEMYINQNHWTIRWAALSPDGNSFNIYDSYGIRDLLQDMAYGFSCVILVGLTGDSEINHRAIVVKPIGIDQVVAQMPDFTIYDFEMVFYNHERQNHVAIKNFSGYGDFSYTFWDVDGNKMRIDSAEWLFARENDHSNIKNAAGNWNSLKWDTIRFRLRNKITKEISNLSYSGIITDNSHKITQRRMLVKSFEDKL